jgi:serine/threonine-protein kinase
MKRCGKCGMQYADSAQFCLQDGQALEVDDLHGTDPYLGQVILGQFAIEALIGEGGMATIYRARQRDIDRPVAIKILRPEISSIAGVVERLHREARLASRLQSPHVAHVYLTGGLPDGRHAIAMEHLEGRMLDKVIDETGALSEVRVVHILRQLGEALTEAHELGIVHRDLKPENIMLVRRGSDEEFVKVLDFGIAKQLGPESSALTGVGLAVGTPLYMSPEAAAGAEVTPASDVYSIGIVTYEMLSGELPFDGETPGSVLLQQVNQEPPQLALRSAAGKTSPGLIALVHRCLAKSPASRPRDGRAFLAALESALLDPTHAAADPIGWVEVAPTLAATPAVPLPASATPLGGTAVALATHAPADVPLVLERSLGELEQVGPGRKRDPAMPALTTGVTPAAPVRRVAGRNRTWIGAALIAVLAIVGVTASLRGPSADDRLDGILRKAERALAAGRLEGRRGAIELTERVLAEQSDNAGARTLRRRIANTLQAEALSAEQQGRRDVALAKLALLERLEPSRGVRARMNRLRTRLDPDPSEAAALRPTAPESRVISLYVQPSNAVAGQRVSIVARTSGALDASSFHIRTAAGEAIVLAASRSSSDTYTASHVFAQGGRYQVGFAGTWAQVNVADPAHPPPPAAAAPEPPPPEPPPAPAEPPAAGEPPAGEPPAGEPPAGEPATTDEPTPPPPAEPAL